MWTGGGESRRLGGAPIFFCILHFGGRRRTIGSKVNPTPRSYVHEKLIFSSLFLFKFWQRFAISKGETRPVRIKLPILSSYEKRVCRVFLQSRSVAWNLSHVRCVAFLRKSGAQNLCTCTTVCFFAPGATRDVTQSMGNRPESRRLLSRLQLTKHRTRLE